jgi:hypothetical protein
MGYFCCWAINKKKENLLKRIEALEARFEQHEMYHGTHEMYPVNFQKAVQARQQRTQRTPIPLRKGFLTPGSPGHSWNDRITKESDDSSINDRVGGSDRGETPTTPIRNECVYMDLSLRKGSSIV